ncbi:Signal recognition particle receptor protein FtsY [Sulfitobacter geojensis]|nr:signal recognition particle-docking protein FtsY [Sulfitobacter geojensis]KHA52880.1 Signal recognition particle receptor protein FtsY [Sulfitobacter geojensis]
MAFFKKLKDRLFKSSSKIDEGLEAIVGDGGTQEQAEELAPQEAAASIETEAKAADAAVQAEKEEAEAVLIEQAAQAEAARVAAEVEAAQREARLAAEELAQEEARAAAQAAARVQAAELERAAQAQKIREAADAAAKQAEEDAAGEAEAARLREEEALAEVARQAEEQRRAAQAAQEEITARQQEEARKSQEQSRREAAEQAAAEQKQRAAEAEAAAEQIQREAEAAKDAAAQAAPTPPEPLKTTLTPVAPDLASDLSDTASTPADKRGLLGRLMGRAAPKTVVRRVLDDDMLEQLEELLIAADMGVDTALRVTANMAEGRFGKKLSVSEIKALMADEIARIMDPVARPLPLYPKTPQVVLVVGVNGSGKTTTIGKLASQFKAAGKSVVIAAGDTFRAAAVEQLQVWGERAGVPVLTAAQGSDPASLAFDAMAQAEAEGADLLLIDTAGRLQNRSDLMEELAKIVRVIRKKDETAPHNTLLVLDATTGQNALNQVKVFQDISDVSGLVMTKLDGTAKGGVLVALADKFGLPIHAIGVGEQIDDLSPFDPQEFADALVGYER